MSRTGDVSLVRPSVSIVRQKLDLTVGGDHVHAGSVDHRNRRLLPNV